MQETKRNETVSLRKRIETKRARNETGSKRNAEFQYFRKRNETLKRETDGNGWKRMETDENKRKRMETLKTDGSGCRKPEGTPSTTTLGTV